MNQRTQKILAAIVSQFIETAHPVGSKSLLDQFNVSSATIRNEMSELERMGYIIQPHTSAGRMPTSRAYRMFVNQLSQNMNLLAQARHDLELAHRDYYLKKAKEKLFDTASILASVTKAVSFASLPDDRRLFYIGISNVLKQPEFAQSPEQASQVIEVLETRFADFLSELEMDDEGTLYIGDENIIPEIQSCSLLVRPYEYKGFKGLMGILGSTRMNYAYNIAALKSAVELL
ncbi:HTH domain-containing protein [Candidatus Peregrinibacteria bacterium]|nr:MAG: HTH domain-containing protein [Candidatus Peregrinibacteria bacterium]